MRRITLLIAAVSLVLLVLAGCSGEQADVSSLIGTDAPDFVLENALGGQTTLSEYQGTPVLLFFHMAVG